MDVIVMPLSISDNQDELWDLFKKQLTSNATPLDIYFLVTTDNCHCAVVKEQGRIVSFGALSTYLVPDKGCVGTIQSMVTHKDYRKRGFGTKILVYLEDLAKGLRLTRLELTSHPKRKNARRLYQSLNYVRSDTNVFYKNL